MRRRHDSLRIFLVFSFCTSVAIAQDVQIGIVEQSPGRAVVLAAAVQAAVREEGAARVAPVEPDEPLALAAHVCAAAVDGSVAVLSGEEPRGAALAAAAAARAGLPLLLVDSSDADAQWEALALYPHSDVLAQACAELCKAKGWRQAVLLHDGGPRGAALIAPDDDTLSLLARRLPSFEDAALLRNLLLVLKKFGAVNFIVWCDAECTVRVLDAAQRVGLLSDRHSYVLLTLDLHTQPLADYSHGGANITGFRLFDPESEAVKRATAEWLEAYTQLTDASANQDDVAQTAAMPPTALVLAYDAAGLVAEALRRIQFATPNTRGDCSRGVGDLHADSLLNYLRSEEWSGVSGSLSWEADGARRDVQLQVVEMQRGGSLKAQAQWTPSAGLSWHRHDPPSPPPPSDSMTNRTFTVLIAESSPYIMKQESVDRLSGNDRYEGFCIELIDRLSKLLNFNYTFIEQKDGVYGNLNNVTQQWNGMMRRLMDDPNVDFAITDLTVTAERETAVDFTTPFMNLGVSILFRTPKPPAPALFAFLLPFSNGVWLSLGLAYVGTSLFLYVVGRLCPEEWQNPYPCVEDPQALENQFTLANALWFNLGAVLLQGSEIAPVAYGTRAVASVWWLFALVITSSYTANLATLLAKKTSSELIHSVQELAENDLGITYGAKEGGSTYTFFEHSQNPLYQKMFEQMKQQKMPKNNTEGIMKVVKENYAFLMESTTIDYVTERNCEVTRVGGLLDSKGYGIAMKKNSTYRQSLNLALLNLQEAGVLREMEHTWWKEKHGGGSCNVVEGRESEELSLSNFYGLFLVLVVGCALGVVVSCCDLAWHSSRRARALGESFGRRFWAELKFVFRFEQSVKPLHGSLSPSPPASEPEGEECEECGEGLEGEGEDGGEGADAARLRSASLHSAAAAAAGAWARRRSMHAASMRLARAKSPADASTH